MSPTESMSHLRFLSFRCEWERHRTTRSSGFQGRLLCHPQSGPFQIPISSMPMEVLHMFTRAKGSATGIGDVTIRVKGNVIQREAFRVALALDIRTPTGNARELLGSGSTGIKPFIAVSAGKRVSPHANIGYQYNGSSILAGNLTGTTISENASGNTLNSKWTRHQRACSRQLFLCRLEPISA